MWGFDEAIREKRNETTCDKVTNGALIAGLFAGSMILITAGSIALTSNNNRDDDSQQQGEGEFGAAGLLAASGLLMTAYAVGFDFKGVAIKAANGLGSLFGCKKAAEQAPLLPNYSLPSLH